MKGIFYKKKKQRTRLSIVLNGPVTKEISFCDSVNRKDLLIQFFSFFYKEIGTGGNHHHYTCNNSNNCC